MAAESGKYLPATLTSKASTCWERRPKITTPSSCREDHSFLRKRAPLSRANSKLAKLYLIRMQSLSSPYLTSTNTVSTGATVLLTLHVLGPVPSLTYEEGLDPLRSTVVGISFQMVAAETKGQKGQLLKIMEFKRERGKICSRAGDSMFCACSTEPG